MIKKFFIIPALCLTVASCSDYDWDFDHNTELSGFDITTSDITIDLTDADIDMEAEHTIEWQTSHAADYSQVFYKVLFSGHGDFSAPDYELEPAAIGTDHKLVLSNKDINIIAEACGVAQKASGDVKWTVRASNGINSVLAATTHNIHVSRPEGFAYIPEAVMLKGGDGASLSMKRTADGVFEAFVYLDNTDYAISDPSAVGRKYSINGDALVRDGVFKPISSGKIHHISINYHKATASIASVEEVGLWYSGTGDVLSVMTAAENHSAVWNATFLFETVDNDLRYKFRLKEKTADGSEKMLYYGYASVTSRPQSSTSPASYFYLVPETGFSGSDYCYSFNRTLHKDKMLSVSVDLQPATENYTHSVTVR